MIKQLPHDPSPWWRHRMMWLVLGGPAAVVVAGVVTAVIAIRGADPVVVESTTAEVRSAVGVAPAMQGRNHAATPAAAKP